MGTPLVSVVIPVFNIEAHLCQCMDSVLDQTLRDLEIICVDDGSTDQSPMLLKRYAERDARVQVLTQANAGPGMARNTGMAAAKGEYLIFLDSDDWFEPDFLEKMMTKAQASQADITICRAVEFDTATGEELPSGWMLKEGYLPGEIFTPQEIADHIFQFTYGWPWDKLYRSEFIKEQGLSYPALPNSEDLVFVFQSLVLAARLAAIDGVLVHHRVNRGNSVSNSRHRDPEVPYLALKSLQEGLIERNLYKTYERSFLNWAMEFLVWNVANMGEPAAQRIYFSKLKNQWLPELAFDAHPSNYYEDKFTYCKYLLARFTPYPIFSGIVNGYHKVKQHKKSKR